MTAQNMTGYPSIDKPWLKYYSEEAIQEKHDADEEAYNASGKDTEGKPHFGECPKR